MSDINPEWSVLGRTDNASFHAVSPRVMVVAPDEGCTDDEPTAQQSVAFQRAHWHREKTSGVAIILMDRVSHQTKGARRVYQSEVEVDVGAINGFALVTNSVFGRAVASVFLGLSRPPVPTRMFGRVAAALVWARARNSEADER